MFFFPSDSLFFLERNRKKKNSTTNWEWNWIIYQISTLDWIYDKQNPFLYHFFSFKVIKRQQFDSDITKSSIFVVFSISHLAYLNSQFFKFPKTNQNKFFFCQPLYHEGDYFGFQSQFIKQNQTTKPYWRLTNEYLICF